MKSALIKSASTEAFSNKTLTPLLVYVYDLYVLEVKSMLEISKTVEPSHTWFATKQVMGTYCNQWKLMIHDTKKRKYTILNCDTCELCVKHVFKKIGVCVSIFVY